MLPNRRKSFLTDTNSNNFANHPLQPKQCELIVEKIIDELGFFAAVLVLDEKERQLRSETNSARYAPHLKEISFQKIKNLIMEITPAFSSLDPQNCSLVIERIYNGCAQKWNTLNPVDHLRSIQHVEHLFGQCFGEIQKRHFMQARGIYQPQIPIEQMQNIATHPRKITNATYAPNMPSQNYVPYQVPQNYVPYQPPQQAIPPATTRSQINPSQPMITVSHPDQINSNFARWNGGQQPNSQQSPANCHPPPSTAQKRPTQESTAPMIATPPYVARFQPIANVESTVGPNMTQPLLHPTLNTPPPTPVNNELPILDSADVADILNEIPSKKAKMEITSKKPANSGDNQIKILQKMELASKNQTKNRLAMGNVPANNSVKNSENVPVHETVSKVVNTLDKDGQPELAITPKAAKEHEKLNANTENSRDDNDYVILVETCTQFKPKIEKMEKIENDEEKQAQHESSNNTTNNRNDNEWYEDISSDSDRNSSHFNQ